MSSQVYDPDLHDSISRLFSQPHLLPKEFLGYIADYIGSVAQPNVSVSQVIGFQQFAVAGSQRTGTASIGTVSATAWSGMSDGNIAVLRNPQLTVPAGSYLILHGAAVSVAAAVDTAYMGADVNGDLAGSQAKPPTGGNSSVLRTSSTTDLSLIGYRNTGRLTPETNTLASVYGVNSATATGNFRDRWIVAVRTANP